MPVMMFTTPGGKPAWSINLANLSRGAGPSSDAFNTTVQPAAKAGANFTADKNIWEFHGTIAATTPIGSRLV